MITKECKGEKVCLFCASEYHLEMILLPYIKEHIDTNKFIVFTENDLTGSLNFVLSRTNLNEETKRKIKKINWENNNKEQFNKLEEYINNDDSIKVIINGNSNYIKKINNELEDKKVDCIDCFHIEDTEVNINKISDNYKYVLNTKKI